MWRSLLYMTELFPDLGEQTARLTVRLTALRANYREVSHRASPAAVAPVVKADSYGLGFEPISSMLARAGADTFFVARLAEAISLRRVLPRARIFVLDGLTPGAAGAVSETEYAAVARGEIPTTCSPRESLAIDYATRFATEHESLDDSAFTALRAVFSDAELLDLTVCVGGWLALGRTLHVLGIDDACRLDLPAADAAADAS